jgi:cell division protein FtsL
MRLKGRHWVVLWLVLFLVVAAVVVARQTAAFTLARRLRDLREERTTLEARRADTERRIRTDRSREVLGARAEKLGLHFPSDSEYMYRLVPDRPTSTLSEGH